MFYKVTALSITGRHESFIRNHKLEKMDSSRSPINTRAKLSKYESPTQGQQNYNAYNDRY